MTEQQRIHTLLKEYGFYAKKSFGQNFLINEGIIRRIVNTMKPESFDCVIEIGPGLGSLTLPLSEKAKKLIAVDADRDMIKVLTEVMKDRPNVTLVQSDFLRFNPNPYSKADSRLFIGNLPYNITSELLEYLLEKGFRSAGVMVQKEVADKLTYVPGKKENCALGAFIKASGELSLVTAVDRSSFDPSPKVDSAFVRIDLKKRIPYSLYPIYQALFKDPNKTIHNCLRQFPPYREALTVLEAAEDPLLEKRARQLDTDTLTLLAKKIQTEQRKAVRK
jgi:16S rRNA (adenine1518-N6/adenine1519-N6)-dimethyltransferase